ncbi:hypothetical protein CRG98_009420, partial [Punica granatum]
MTQACERFMSGPVCRLKNFPNVPYRREPLGRRHRSQGQKVTAVLSVAWRQQFRLTVSFGSRRHGDILLTVPHTDEHSIPAFPVFQTLPVPSTKRRGPKLNLLLHFAGEGNSDLILESLLTYTALEDTPEEQQTETVVPNISSSDYEDNFLDDFSDIDSDFDNEEIVNPMPEEDKKMMLLAEMGYTLDEASVALERCGAAASVADLSDFICAAQMSKAADALLPVEK